MAHKTYKNQRDDLLSIEAAAQYMGVSRSTFNNIRKENNLPEILVGKRARFLKHQLDSILSPRTSTVIEVEKSKTKVALNILSAASINQIEVAKNVFDLKLIAQIDPYGALSLLCLLISRTKESKKVKLLIDDKQICQYLKTIKFFYHLENECGDSVYWNKKILRGAEIQDTEILMPIHAIKSKGGERIIAENLLQHLRKQGFKDSVGRNISIVLGELADNAMTHSNNSLSERVCYVSAKRFIWRESNCVIISVADPGIGIPASLKSNPQYESLTDEKAFVTAFKPFVTSWTNTKRGKGLTDVLSIALGNHSMLRVDCGSLGLSMDLREKGNPILDISRNPMANVNGTRFGLILIDTNFEKTERSEIEALISKKAGEL